jgi:hypothetical protein
VFQLSLYATTSVSCLSSRRVVVGNHLTSLPLNDIDAVNRKTSLTSRRHVPNAQSPNETKKGKGRLRKIDLPEESNTSKFLKTSFPLRMASR